MNTVPNWIKAKLAKKRTRDEKKKAQGTKKSPSQEAQMIDFLKHVNKRNITILS